MPLFRFYFILFFGFVFFFFFWAGGSTAPFGANRCDNPPNHPWGGYSFPEPDALQRERTDTVLDVVNVPNVKPGKYDPHILQPCPIMTLFRATQGRADGANNKALR